MSQSAQSMLMFTLGPVQSFISQARKTRDLWIGSFLLSKLMEAAMAGIEGEFVFPDKRTIEGTIPDLPNKYVALFASAEDAEKAACLSEMQLAARWYAICNEVRARLLENTYTPEIQEIWERQISVRQFFEIYWVVVPDPGGTYGSWLEQTTLALEARKRLRDFLPQDEPGEKSTISGEREVLHGKDTSREGVRAFWRRLTANDRHTIKDIKKDGSERLDAIDSIKRFALYSSHLKPGLEQIVYPSTSSIAAARFVEKLLNSSEAEEPFAHWGKLTQRDYYLALKNPNALPYLNRMAREKGKEWVLNRDGDLFFQEAFTPRFLKENYRLVVQREEARREPNLRVVPVEKPETFIPECRETLQQLYRALGAAPTPYYALVQMDGDRMGTILSAVSGSEQHKGLSSALSTFARGEAPRIVEQMHPGRLVYAGGDDVLALTPLGGLLTMVDTLQRRYKEVVAPAAPVEKVTASMGIAIAHHFTPLSVVRRAVWEAEKLAKNRYGRNAVVVTLLRRSGEQTRVGCHWEYDSLAVDGQPFTPSALFDQFSTYFLHDVFSPKSIHNLLSEAYALIGLDQEARCSEIRRVLTRQLNERLSEKQLALLLGEENQHLSGDERKSRIAKKIALLARQIGVLAEAMDQELETRRATEQGLHISAELHDDTLRYGLVEICGWLLVMAFLAREGWEA